MPQRSYPVPRKKPRSTSVGRKNGSGRTKTKKKEKSLKRLKLELWELCKQIIRLTYGNTCYTCGKTGLEGSSWHTGHFIPSSTCGLYLRYSLRNLRPQCYFCNINLGGNGSSFYRNMVEREGVDFVEQLFADKQRITKSSASFFLEKIAEYKELLSNLST